VGSEPLQKFAQRARIVRTTLDLVGAVMDCAATTVGAAVSGCFLQTAASLEIRQTGASDALAQRHAAFIVTSVDPIHAALAERHIAVRSNDLFDHEEWTRHPFHRDVEAAFDLDAYMAAEIIDDKGPRGVIGVARKTGCPPFSVLDAQRLQAICLHASIALTRLGLNSEGRAAVTLTSKQRELVRLVANGFTNDQIARACGVSSHAIKKSLERLYTKADVASRAELVARIQLWEP
jgi:DNA-binding CsgD family transcriptional regulator